MEVAVQVIDQAIEDLKKEAASLVEEVRRMLRSIKIQKKDPEDAQEKKAKPLWIYIRERPGYRTVAIVWTRVLYFNKQLNLPHYRDIARGRGYQISQGKFMKYCRGYHSQIQEELMGYEHAFGGIRRRQAHLIQARSHLLQYQKESAQQI